MSLLFQRELGKLALCSYQIGVLSVFAFDYGLQDFRLHIHIGIGQEFGKQRANVVLPIAEQDHRLGTFELDHIAFALVREQLGQKINGRVVAHFENSQVLSISSLKKKPERGKEK